MQTPVWRIEMLGQLRLRRGEQVVTRFRTTRAALLLARLALLPRQAHAREELADLFWPDAEPQIGRNRLKQEISTLRRILEPEGEAYGSVLQADRNLVALREGTVQTDAGEFETLVTQASAQTGKRLHLLTQAADVARGELLPGFYEDWILRERDRLNLLRADTFRRLAAAQEEAGQIEAAIGALQQLFALDATQEATANLMRLYIQMGQAPSALQQFRRWEKIAREDHGISPSRQLRELAARAEAVSHHPVALPSVREKAANHEFANGKQAADAETTQCPASRALLSSQHVADPSASEGADNERPLPFQPRLPVTLTRFFGRENELEQLRAWLAFPDSREETETAIPQSRLVTITGVAGSGKTRLAITVARSLAREYAGAVAFVALADLTAPEPIAEAALTALRLSRTGNGEPMDLIASRLSQSPHLLVFDNFEQLVDGGAEWLAELRARVPTLTCLVTSRRTLELEGEREWLLAPLPVPPSSLLSCSSVQLFLDRARIARPDFQLNARNAEAIAAICTRLEGLPLALELAAARINILSAAQILKQLEHRFAFLISKRRDIAPRHRSLYAALQWSYDLLPLDLQTFFCCLSVFRGGFTIEAAQSVCEAPDALGMVENLRAHSLLFVEDTGAEMRFRLLETMREWGQEHLEAEAQTALTRRHADFYLLLAERGEPELFGAEQALWFARLDADNDNLESALETGLSCPATAAIGLRLANALWHYWQVRARIQTGENWLRRGLEAYPNANPVLRAKAFLGLGYLAREQHRHREAEAFLRQALHLYEQEGDAQGQGSARGFLSTLTTVDRQEQEMLVNRSLEQCRESGYRQGEAFALFKLAGYAPDPDTRIALMEQSRVLFAELGNWRRLAIVSGELAYLLRWHKDDYATALRLCEDAVRLSRKVGDVASIAHALWHTGDIVNIQGDYTRAVAFFEEAIELCGTHNIQGIALPMYLWALASAHWKQGQFSPAQSCLQQCREIYERQRNVYSIALVNVDSGFIAYHRGDWKQARMLGETAIAQMRAEGVSRWNVFALNLLARVETRLEDGEQARIFVADELRQRDGANSRLMLAEGVESAARVAVLFSDLLLPSVRWLAAAQTTREQIGAPLPPVEQSSLSALLHTLRERLGEPDFAAAWEQGKQLSIAQAFAEAQTFFSC